jgi:antitoxin component HigA of HigAB toxin-antitoxin module
MTEDIKKRIKLMGLKKAYVAEKIGASSSELSHFLAGRRRLNTQKLYQLKKYLGLN